MVNPLAYVKESRLELGKVVWPTRNQTIRLTLVVIVVSILVGAYITLLDTAFTNLISGILKAK